MSEIDAVRLESEVYPVVKIHAFGEIKNGGTPSSDEANWDGDIPFITPPDLNGLDSKSVASVGRTITELGLKQGSNLVENGVIISGRAPVGYVGVVVTPAAFNQGCKAICTAQNHRYVAYALTASKSNLQVLANGTTFPEISSTALANYAIPLPPLETQRHIADYLDRETTEIDAAVADLDRYVELLEKRKWQQLNEILENSLHSRVRLSVAAKMKTGTTPSTLLENEEGVPWLKPDGLGVQSTGQRIDFEMLGESLLSPGGTTYVCGIGATIGKVGYSEEPSITNQQITALTPVLNIIPKLFYYSVLTLTDWLRRTAPGSTLPILNNARLGTYSVRIPVLDVQQAVLAEIESLFHETDQIIAESTRLRDLLLKRRSVLITEVVTGRKQV